MMLKRASNLLMLLVLALLWVPGIMVLGGFILGRQIPDPSQPLYGVVERQLPSAAGLEAVLDGKFQKAFSTALPSQLPLYASISRGFNSIQYSLFNASSNREVLVGRDQYLLGTTYTSAYCSRDIAASATVMTAWAKSIAEIQAAIERRGQKFLYVLTPSKVEYMPEKLPPGYPCPSADRDIFIAETLKHLDRAGVNYIDATRNLADVEARYGHEPYPKGGIHWTDLAALAPSNAIAERLNEMTGRRIAVPYEVQVRDAPVASNEEQDFAYLMNMASMPKPNRVAEILHAPEAPGECPPPASIVTVGGSFFTAIARNLVRGPCPPSVRQLSYLVVDQRRFYLTGPTAVIGVEKLDYGVLESADVVILEENAGLLLRTNHVPALHRYVTTGVLPPQH